MVISKKDPGRQCSKNQIVQTPVPGHYEYPGKIQTGEEPRVERGENSGAVGAIGTVTIQG